MLMTPHYINTYLTFHNSDILTISHNINKELSLVVTWLTQNKLFICKPKIKIVVFHMPQRHVSYSKFTITDETIEVVNDYKFLGTVIIINKHIK